MKKEQLTRLQAALTEVALAEADAAATVVRPVPPAPAFGARMEAVISAHRTAERQRRRRLRQRVSLIAAALAVVVGLGVGVLAPEGPLAAWIYPPAATVPDVPPLLSADNPTFYYFVSENTVKRYNLRTGYTDMLCREPECEHKAGCPFYNADAVVQDERYVYFMRPAQGGMRPSQEGAESGQKAHVQLVQYEPATRTCTVLDEYASKDGRYTQMHLHGGYLYAYQTLEEESCITEDDAKIVTRICALRRVELSTGEVKTYALASTTSTTVVCAQNGRLYGSNANSILSTDLNRGDPQVHMTAPAGGRIVLLDVARSGEIFYVLYPDKADYNTCILYCLDPATGHVTETAPLKGRLFEAQEINGRLYFTHYDKAVTHKLALYEWVVGEEPSAIRPEIKTPRLLDTCGTCLFMWMYESDNKSTLVCIDTEA